MAFPEYCIIGDTNLVEHLITFKEEKITDLSVNNNQSIMHFHHKKRVILTRLNLFYMVFGKLISKLRII